MRKGIVVISENLLMIGGLIVSMMLVMIIFYAIFSQQSETANEAVLIRLTRDLAARIDRIAASSGTSTTLYVFSPVPEIVAIRNKKVSISLGNITADAPFDTDIINGSYTFETPDQICIIKKEKIKFSTWCGI